MWVDPEKYKFTVSDDVTFKTLWVQNQELSNKDNRRGEKVNF